MGRPGRQKRSGPCWLVTDLVSDGDKGKQRAVYPAVAGISVQAVAALRSGSAGAWTVPPGGLRFTQLALPNEEGARKKEGYGKDCYNIIKEGECRYVFFSS